MCAININVCNPNYCHRPMSEKTDHPRDGGSSHTLLLLCSSEEIDYAKIIEGAADMITYLQFWGEVSQFTSLSGKSMHSGGDYIIVDNCLMRLLNTYSTRDPG